MMSLNKFYNSCYETQNSEIERTYYILELLYDRYQSSGAILLRGTKVLELYYLEASTGK